jgi:FO synthase
MRRPDFPFCSAEDAVLRAAAGQRLDGRQALALADIGDPAALLAAAATVRDRGHGVTVTYSKKVFIPLTQLCRDVCHYCTFAQTPKRLAKPYLAMDEVLRIAGQGAAAGCREALFTLGDRPEHRYREAREALAEAGYASTLEYLHEAALRVHAETGLLPHLNPGVMSAEEILALRDAAPSMGLMLESAADRLTRRGMPHHGSPDKAPAVRLATIAAAGEARVPFTSGILIGIGETRRERIESLLALRELHERFGHLQEIIIQNFRAKPGTRMAAAPEPALAELAWTIAAARLLFGAQMNIQAPPNLSEPESIPLLIRAGINDWGGISPVTKDYVNPERPWPGIGRLAEATAAEGKLLCERLAIYPAWVRDAERWTDARFHVQLRRDVDGEGLPRADAWHAGAGDVPVTVAAATAAPAVDRRLTGILAAAMRGDTLSEAAIVRLFRARGAEFTRLCRAADALRRDTVGDIVTYVVNRNINYTNICTFHCRFCAFSKGRTAEHLRGSPYDLDPAAVAARTREAWQRGATEVCLQGGIHPAYTGETYFGILRAVREAAPGIHVHAFSPLEARHGAHTLGVSLAEYLQELKRLGLGSLPGTAAEILDDEVRAVLCPDKLTTAEWLEVMKAAHRTGLRSTATIMFGHADRYEHWARHLLRIRALQADTGGFTEFVPLPFVHMEAPMYRRGMARRGPTLRESILMHAVARLALYPQVVNIQASWVKMGAQGAVACLEAGCNDFGGTLMNESISRAAGAAHGQELTAVEMEELIRAAGRTPRQRTTLYGEVDAVPGTQTPAAVLAECC